MHNFRNAALKLTALLAVACFALPGYAQRSVGPQGGPFQGGAARAVQLSGLSLAAGRQAAQTIPFLSNIPQAQLDALKAQSAATRGTPAVAPLPGGAPRVQSSSGGPSVQSSGSIFTVTPPDVSFDGDFQNETNCSDSIPADQALAIGDNSNPVLQAVNLCLSVWSPAGVRLTGPVSLRTFFNVPITSTVLNYPRALYDWYNHRFIVTMLDSDNVSKSYYNIAVSQTDDPTGSWYLYRFQTPVGSGVLNDFPRVGQDATATYPLASGTTYSGAIYIASNLYSFPSLTYVAEEWIILPKSLLYNGLPLTNYAFENLKNPDGSTSFTSQPANVWNPYDFPRAEFFLESETTNKLVVWAVSNPFAYLTPGKIPELTRVAITTTHAFLQPPVAVQSGGSLTINTGDTRISGQVTYNAGYLYGSLNAANGTGGTESIIYKVRPILNVNDPACAGAFLNACPQITTATIADESVLNFGTTTSAFYATPQPDIEGDVTTVFSFVSASTFASLAYVQQRVTASNTFAENVPIYLKQGTAFYTQGRWGDYPGRARPAGVGYTPTFVSNTGVGFAGMYASPGNCAGIGGGCWNTRIGYVQFTNPTQP